jgi:hypothetical protein
MAVLGGVPLQWVKCFDIAFVLLRLESLVFAVCSTRNK